MHFLFIGEGTEYKNIEKWIENKKASNINLLPAVSDIEYQSILKECDVGIISLRSSFKTDNFPNKIMNYMEYQLPILASVNPGNELIELIEDNKNGLVANNGEDEQLFKNATKLIEDSELREKMGLNGYKLLKEKFDSNKAVNSILIALDDK